MSAVAVVELIPNQIKPNVYLRDDHSLYRVEATRGFMRLRHAGKPWETFKEVLLEDASSLATKWVPTQQALTLKFVCQGESV